MVKEGYKQTGIGVIPEDWECVELLSKCNLLNGLTYTPNDIVNNGLLVIRSSNVQNNQLVFVDNVYVDLAIDEQKLIKKDDIVICVRNGSAALIGKCAMATKDYQVTFGAFMAVLRGENNGYIFQLLQQGTIQKHISKNSGATINQITNGDFKEILIPVPVNPLEQKRITEALSDVDDMISSLEKLIEKKKAIKQGAMQDLLTGKKRLPGFTGEWKKRTLNEISTEIVDGPFGSDLKSEHYISDPQVRVIQLSNIGETGWGDENTKYTTFAHAKELSRCIVQPGSLLIAKMMPAGRAILCPDSEKGYILGSDVVKLVPNSSIDSRYLVYATKSKLYLDQISEDTQGSTRSRTSVSKLRKTLIWFPTKLEQTAIANILSDIDSEIEELEQKLNKTIKLKQGMMQQLLTGKIRLVEEDTVIEPVRIQNNTAKTQTGHNHQFDDAVMIAAIVNAFYSEKYPLGRKKVQKLLYLLRRKQEVDTSAFKKKAAGPYADEVRYKGGEPIAKSNGYISASTSKKGTSFSKGKNIDDAISYVEKWNKQADIDWLFSTFKYVGVNDLELYATVDMAICDLKHQGVEVTVDSIKNLIRSNDVWKAKLKKKYFSDADIARAIDMSKQLFSN